MSNNLEDMNPNTTLCIVFTLERYTMSEASIRFREEDDILQRSTKKVKENHQDSLGHENQRLNSDVEGRSYRDKLVGECLGVFKKVFEVENTMEMEAMSDDDLEENLSGKAIVRITGDRKGKIQAAWTNALIVKVFG